HTGTERPAPAPLEIKFGVMVDLDAGTLTSGKIESDVLTSSQETYTLANGEFISFGIYGRFGRKHELPLGILGGIVKYGQHADASLIVTADLPLIGVIGRAGALGIFRDPSSNNLVGGFEAGIVTNYEAFNTRAINTTGFNPSLGQHTNSNKAIIRAAILPVNADETGLTVKNTATDTDITSFATGTRYGLNDDNMNPNGFILASGSITTVPHSASSLTGTELRIVGAGFLSTTNLGAVILDTLGSATWEGKAYVIDHIDTTTKIFELTFKLNFTAGTFRTDGAVAVTSKIGADGVSVPITTGQTGQTLRIAGAFGQGLIGRPPGRLELVVGEPDFEYNDGTATRRTTAFYGAIGRRGATGVFQGGDSAGNYAFAGGFWAGPSTTVVTTTTEVEYGSYLSFYGGTNAEKNVVNSATGTTEPKTFVRFLNGIISGTSTATSTFRLGGADADATNNDGLRFYVADNVKTVGLLSGTDNQVSTDDTNLGAVLPITTPSAIWYGRLFVKTDATAFNPDNEKQIGLNVNFGEGTIDTPRPVKFTIGAQTHSLSVHGRFGLNDFARDSDVPAATGLLSGFVEYTHHGAQTAAKFPLIGLIGTEGVLGIFKGNVANVGLVGGFEATAPDTVADAPNHATYLEQFGGYINGSVKDNFASQISEADGVQLIRTPTDRNP
ncbi:MAG: hypothetical protein K8953_09355, partial [Proteobacteria bacterium]|nr:hypothetical protein [Pseudomonadota bacterium]